MANTQTTHPAAPTGPPLRALSVRMDDQLYDDLTVIMQTGATPSDAVRRAVAQLADHYRTAWDNGTPEGAIPQ